MKDRSIVRIWKAACRAGLVSASAALLALSLTGGSAHAVPAEFAYQAQLLDSFSGQPITSSDVTITIRLYPSAVSSIPLKTYGFANQDLSASEGYVNLELSSVGLNLNADLWVEVTVDDNTDSQPAETLLPRQQITSVPFALNAANLEGDSLADIRAYADNAAANAETNANSHADTVAATAETNANAYTDAQIAALPPGGGGGLDPAALDNFNRVVFVNPDITQSATANGALYDPFDNLNDAYAHAKTISGAGSFFDRIVIELMPGQHMLTSTLVMDTVGIDLVGYGNRDAFIRGTADPMIQMTAGTSGAWLRNLNIRPSGGTNVAVEALGGGRLTDVVLSRTGAPQGTLLDINITPQVGGSTYSLSVNDFEIYGDVNVTQYGDQLSFSNGFILGTVTSTGNVTADLTELLSFRDVSSIGALDFQPASGAGLLALSNVQVIAGVTWDTNSIVLCSSTNFINPATFLPLALPQPAAGSSFINTVGYNYSGWAGPAQSAGNVDVAGPPARGYIAYLAQ